MIGYIVVLVLGAVLIHSLAFSRGRVLGVAIRNGKWVYSGSGAPGGGSGGGPSVPLAVGATTSWESLSMRSTWRGTL